jgi:hypothetical protein
MIAVLGLSQTLCSRMHEGYGIFSKFLIQQNTEIIPIYQAIHSFGDSSISLSSPEGNRTPDLQDENLAS